MWQIQGFRRNKLDCATLVFVVIRIHFQQPPSKYKYSIKILVQQYIWPSQLKLLCDSRTHPIIVLSRKVKCELFEG